MKMHPRALVACLAASSTLLGLAATRVSTTRAAGDTGVSAAICPIVYQLDESTSARGYHYIFYGNAFFIDKEGYLITAAHVLSDFHDGGQPYILLRKPEAPPQLLKAEVVATDPQHDIAILRAVPNPFKGRYQVSYLLLAASKPALGAAVLAAALRPSRLKDPHSFDAPQEDSSSAEVLEYVSTSLSKGQANAELFLFSHEVIRGQSGAPVVSRESQKAVVGIVEGRWLHSGSISVARTAGNRTSTIGAAIPITYAIPLLEEKRISWQAVSRALEAK
jgi:S1-C subfamily serine protease